MKHHADPLDAIAAQARPPRPRPEPDKLDEGDRKTLERRMRMAVGADDRLPPG